MKKVLWKELGRAIWKTKTRFLSILAIIAVGTGFFAGIKVSCPDMMITAKQYFAENRLMDLHLVSTLGFSKEDLAAVQETGGIRGMMPAYSVDTFLRSADSQGMIVKALSIPLDREEKKEDYLNRPVLKEGRLPEHPNECVVEQGLLGNAELNVGDTLTLYREDQEITDTLSTDTFTIVGIVETAQYISFTRGNSLIGDGTIDAYIMVPEEAFSLEVYTDVYLTLDSTADLAPYTDEYDAAVEEKADELEKIAEVRAEARYNEIKDDAQAEIDKAKAELADGEKQAESELSDAWKKLQDAKKQLEDGKKEYESGLSTFEVEIANGKKQLADAQTALENGKKEYEDGLAQYESGLKQFEAERPAALEKIAAYEKQAEELRAQLEAGRTAINGAKQTVGGIETLLDSFASISISDPALFPDDVKQLLAAVDQLEAGISRENSLSQLLTVYIQVSDPGQKAQLRVGIEQGIALINDNIAAQEKELATGEAGLQQLETGIAEGKATLAATEQTLAETKTTLDAAKAELDTGAKTLEEQSARLTEEESKSKAELEAAKKELDNGRAEYDKGLKEYNDGKAESDAKLADARKQIKDAENQLAELSEPTWYVWDRENNPGYTNYRQDAEKVDAIAKVFPVFFVLIAALVCLTTMTRMVEEERTHIGTMKALGYGRRAIIRKYLLYAVSASVVGSAVGLTIGFQLFPRVIIGAYEIMYDLPDPLTPFRWDYAAVCTLVAVLCTGVSAFAACYKALMTSPAQLMRPRAPKSGKRVLLERIRPFWSRLSFIHKVTVRNIFRYKKRVAMTVIGVAGCTALLLTGFGFKHAIAAIADRQYGEVFVYDALAVTEEKTDMAALQEKLDSNEGIERYLGVTHKTMDATDDKVIKSVNLYVPEDIGAIGDYISLRERIGGKKLTLGTEGVIISEKLSKQLHAGVGDAIILNNPDGRPITVEVTGVTENYAMNFVYMSPQEYEEKFRTETQVNTLLIDMTEGTDSAKLAEDLLGYGGILGMSFSEDGMEQFKDTISSLDSIIWVLIVSAGALALIVMYNLVNINVNERVRELATIKVLGFHDKEVSAYIYRENNIAAGVGMAVGLVLGIFLEKFVIATAEIDEVMFAPDINLMSFVLAALLTILFVLIVNVTLHFQLKRISMVESLKSVE